MGGLRVRRERVFCGGASRYMTADSPRCGAFRTRSEEHTSELQSQSNLVCRLLLEKKKKKTVCMTRTDLLRLCNWGTPYHLFVRISDDSVLGVPRRVVYYRARLSPRVADGFRLWLS